MQNEFEKQVQQKLEELKLVPSEPVWQKVEMQIRRKKDRRRLIFWLPLSALLLGGGLWIALTQHSQLNSNKAAISVQKPTLPITKKANTATKNSNINTVTGNHIKSVVNNQKKNQNQPETRKNSSTAIEQKTIAVNKNGTKPVLQKSFSKKFEKQPERITETKKAIQDKADEITPTTTTTSDKVSAQRKEQANTLTTASEVSKDSIVDTNQKEKEEKIAVTQSDSIKKDSALIPKSAPKKIAESKWKYSIVAGTGVSGLGRLNIYNGMKDSASGLSYSGSPNQSSSGGGSLRYGPSAIKKSLSFSIGILGKKELKRQIDFSVGLQYHYYSNTISVGNRITQTTVIRDVSVSQYYTNASTSPQPYRNHYHFLSLPLAIDWQLLKKKPLDFHAGLSLQYLIQTNALVFDYNKQAYFYSKKAFNRMQLFSDWSFSYSIPLKKNTVAIGSQVQYGLARLEKGNPSYHLFAYGVNVRIEFDKK